MVKIFRGEPRASISQRFACVISRFNEEITQGLLEGALEAFMEAGIEDGNVDVYQVPGAFEIPIVLKHALLTGEYAGAVVLSSVVKGDTDHDRYIARALTEGVSRLSLEFNLPVTYGVITARTWRQAVERSGGRHGNRGRDAALALLEIVNLLGKARKEP